MPTEVIYCGDNLNVLPKYVPDEFVDLVYIDPPFNTGRTYEVFWGEEQERRAYEDRYGDPRQYVAWMEPRLRHLYRVLKPTGSFYLHCDPTASHYLKMLLDDIFGFRQFRNEIVWKRIKAHSDARRWSPVHDVLLYYGKSSRVTWNPPRLRHEDEYLRVKYRYQNPDGRRYRLDNMTSPNPRPNMMYEWKGYPSPPKGWRFKRETMEKLDAEGRIWYPKDKTQRPQIKRYLDEMPGTPMGTVWTDVAPINSQALERQGYPTQKPLPLLERILSASSNPDDVVLDAFCGCGTTLEAAVRLKRRWIGIDFSPTACRVMASRLENLGLRERRDFRLVDLPRTRDELRRMPPLEFQNWAVTALGGIPNRVKVGDLGIDGRLYLADRSKPLGEGRDLFGQIGAYWFPIQVKQKDKAGRPDIDSFETAMRRDRRRRGYFVSFGYTRDAELEIRRAARQDGLEIIPVTVDEILEDEWAFYGEPPVEFSAARLRQQSVQPPPSAQSRLPEAAPASVEPAKPGRRRRSRAG